MPFAKGVIAFCNEVEIVLLVMVRFWMLTSSWSRSEIEKADRTDAAQTDSANAVAGNLNILERIAHDDLVALRVRGGKH